MPCSICGYPENNSKPLKHLKLGMASSEARGEAGTPVLKLQPNSIAGEEN